MTATARYRTFWRRFWAGFIDGLVLMPLSWIDATISVEDHGATLFLAWSAISYSAYWLYTVSMHARYGQTVGKMALGVVVMDLGETRIPTWRQAFMRDVVYVILNVATLVYLVYLVTSGGYVSGAEYSTGAGALLVWASLAWFALELLTMLTNDKRRAVHDFIAGTVVVRK